MFEKFERTAPEDRYVDWDGIGTAAFFFASGAVGVGLTLLKAYSLSLKAKIERERIRAGDHGSDEVLEELQTLTTQVHRLSERMDFTERLVGSGQKPTQPEERPGP